MIKLIGTHDSATGEKPNNFLSFLGTPIAKCQTKTILQQLKAGVRMFDLRVKPYSLYINERGKYPNIDIKHLVLGHGLCDYSITFFDALATISQYATEHKTKMYILVAYESGKLTEDTQKKFIDDVKKLVSSFPKLTLLEIDKRNPTWTVIYYNKSCGITYRPEQVVLEGWKLLLPFPWFWNKFKKYNNKEEKGVYSLRDFV